MLFLNLRNQQSFFLCISDNSDWNLQFILFNLTELGFVIYDADRQLINCNEKLFNYIDNRSGKKDYDVLIVNSNYLELQSNKSDYALLLEKLLDYFNKPEGSKMYFNPTPTLI